MRATLRFWIVFIITFYSYNCFGISPDDLKSLLETPLFCPVGQPCQGLKARMEHYHIPGISLALVHKGKLAFVFTEGIQSTQSNQQVSPETLFQACSISKPFAALISLNLIKEGKFALDQDINTFLKSWKVPTSSLTKEQPVTIRTLLNHTAGFRPGRGYDFGLKDRIPNITEVLNGKYLDGTPLQKSAVVVEFKPGSRWQYSTTGYAVLQQALEDITNRPFEALGNEFLHKLGMNHSTFTQPLPPKLRGLAANAHDEHGKPFPESWYVIPEVAAAGLWTTPTDLSSFIIEMHNAVAGNKNSPIPPEISKTMLTPYFESFGLGIRVDGVGKNKWFSHGGDNRGYKSLLMSYPYLGEGLVIMTNSDSGFSLAQEIFKAIADHFKWPVPKEIKF